MLFTLLAGRYERSSVLITSIPLFSKWEAIFKTPTPTVAASVWTSRLVRLVYAMSHRGKLPYLPLAESPAIQTEVGHSPLEISVGAKSDLE